MGYNPNQPRDWRGRWTSYGGTTYRQNASYSYISRQQTIADEQALGLSLEVDELIPCLRDAATGKLLETEVAEVPKKEWKKYHSRNGWYTNWSKLKADVVFGVYLKGDTEPQGLIALTYERGGVYIDFVCAAPHNNKQLSEGRPPRYTGICGHLFAVAAEESFKAGNIDACIVGFATNKKILNHYIEKFGAKHIPIIHEYQFMIDGKASQDLINTYNYTRR